MSSESQWISVDGLDGATALLRQVIEIRELPDSALVTVTALGYFELYINGNRAGDRVLDPPVCNFSRRAFEITHEIVTLLQPGRNCIGLRLGRGWYRGFGLGPAGDMNPHGCGPLPGVVSEGPVVRVSLQPGDELPLSDTEWRGAPGPIIEQGTWRCGDFGGEIYDAGREIPGWTEPDFDDSGWKPAVAVAVPPLETVPAEVEATRILESFPIDNFREIEPGMYEGDAGTCLTGWLELEFGSLKAGREITITYSDCAAHKVFNRYNQEDRYIARGSGAEVFRNRFNVHGFRWVRVQGAQPVKGTAYMTGTDLEPVTRFRTSSERLNRIHALVTHTLRCLTIGGVQVDCPHRERLPYGGDAAASLLSMLTHFDCRKFYTHWLRLWRDEQRPDGGLPHTAPAPYLAGGGPVWCGFPLTAAWQNYLYYGETSFLRDQYPSACSWFDYVGAYTKDGLLRKWPETEYRQWYLGDWLPPMGVDAADEDSITLVNNCFIVQCYERAAAIAQILEQTEEAEAYSNRAKDLRRRIHEVFYHDGVYASASQIDLAYPLLVQAVPADLRGSVLKRLIEEITCSGAPRIGTGLVGTAVLFELLTEEGRGDLAAAMVDTDDFPGWGNMLVEGETAVCEYWERTQETHLHNCFNQVNGWFIRGLIGLQPLAEAPGFRRFMLHPQPGEGITWAEAECRTAAGTIAVRWEQEEGFRLQVTVPQGSEADIILPDGSRHNLSSGGHELSS